MFDHARAARNRGFTLMELMATLALLATLTAFAIPAFSGYAERARVNAAVSDIGRISIELHRWRMDNDGAFPDTLAELPIVVNPDPWGNAYVYEDVATAGGGTLRTNGGVEVNTEFDLYSRGPDGASSVSLTAGNSLDDVVLAHDGAFVGQADHL